MRVKPYHTGKEKGYDSEPPNVNVLIKTPMLGKWKLQMVLMSVQLKPTPEGDINATFQGQQ
jgi:hypothetical protein